jgi:hypothetical protein
MPARWRLGVFWAVVAVTTGLGCLSCPAQEPVLLPPPEQPAPLIPPPPPLLTVPAGGLPSAPKSAAMPVSLLVPLPDEDHAADPVPADTNAGFIDPASPWNVLRLRFDAAWNMNRPTRSEYFLTCSLNNRRGGLNVPESRVDYQQLSLYGEWAILPQFSMFIDAPLRFINPQINTDETGPSDLSIGFKLLGVQTHTFTGSFEFVTTAPTGQRSTGLGTGHTSLSAAILTNWQPLHKLILEGSFTVWMPLDDSRYGGEMLMYAIAVSYGDHPPGEFWVAPVFELTGWTAIRGLEQVTYSITDYSLKPAEGDTIVNSNLGVRVGFGLVGDVYAGYSRSLTGERWYKDLWRVEVRWRY